MRVIGNKIEKMNGSAQDNYFSWRMTYVPQNHLLVDVGFWNSRHVVLTKINTLNRRRRFIDGTAFTHGAGCIYALNQV
jgi:hypothetical protein